MSRNLIVFGASEQAEIVSFYFNTFSEFRVQAYVLDKEFITGNSFLGKPVIDSESVVKLYPPENFEMFIALGYSRGNLNRKNKYEEFKKWGYKFPSYLSDKAVILVDKDRIGENSLILENNTIQPFVKLGNNVVVWSGNHIGHHTTIGNHVFISSHVVISGGVAIGDACFLGVNSTIRDHIKIGANSVIGAGALVLKDCEEKSLFRGNKSNNEYLRN